MQATLPHARLHIPERLPRESQADYKARCKASKDWAQFITLTGRYTPAGSGHPSSRAELRANKKRNGTFIAGAFGIALRNVFQQAREHRLRERTARRIAARTSV